MIKRLVMAAVILIAVGAHPYSEERIPSPPVRLGPVLFPKPREDSESNASGVKSSLALVECQRIAGVMTNRSCNNHCRLLQEEYKSGECIEGRCICKKEDKKISCDESCLTRCKALGQEGSCVKGVCYCHEVELECKYHESCSSHCLSLGHTESRCHEGICRCGIISENSGKFPTVKCAELISIDEKERNHDKLCYAHCRSLREGYRRGECEKGICHCSI